MSTTNLTEGVFSCCELQNNIEWTPYETVNKALNIGNTHNVNTTMYPSNFTLEETDLYPVLLASTLLDTSNSTDYRLGK